MHHNWFSRLTGFNEEAYATTQAQMEVQVVQRVASVPGCLTLFQNRSRAGFEEGAATFDQQIIHTSLP